MYYTLHHSGRISRYSLGSASPPRTELSRLGFVLLCLREANCKTRAAVVTIFSRECPAVRFDDAAGNREPHSGALRFCGKEWLEKLFDHPLGKAGTRIAHADNNFSVSVTAGMNDKASRIGTHSRHCFKG